MWVRIVSTMVAGALAGCSERVDEKAGASQAVCWMPFETGPAAGSVRPPVARFEVCNNGLDDDGDGLLDDGCACAVGAVQPCFPGGPEIAGVGACAMGVQTCVARGAVGGWGPCGGAGTTSAEWCNRIDDDCDGQVDEVCECEVGATQPCYASDAPSAGVGGCRAGTQTCVPSGKFEGGSFGAWDRCEEALGPVTETCNGLDDDCDGVADDIGEICNLADDDCDGVVDDGDACAALPPAFFLTPFWPPTGSGLLPPSEPVYALREVAPEAALCGPGEVLLADRPGHLICVPEPPEDCPPGTHPQWIDAAWDCVPCDVVVQFGYLFDFERTCAPEPALMCPAGDVPTFDEVTREWLCAPECDNTDYDRAYRNGQLVCVPC